MVQGIFKQYHAILTKKLMTLIHSAWTIHVNLDILYSECLCYKCEQYISVIYKQQQHSTNHSINQSQIIKEISIILFRICFTKTLSHIKHFLMTTQHSRVAQSYDQTYMFIRTPVSRHLHQIRFLWKLTLNPLCFRVEAFQMLSMAMFPN